MSIKAGVGMSQHHNPNVRGREAAGQALEMAGISKPEFVFMFRLNRLRSALLVAGRSARLPERHPSQVVRRQAR